MRDGEPCSYDDPNSICVEGLLTESGERIKSCRPGFNFFKEFY